MSFWNSDIFEEAEKGASSDFSPLPNGDYEMVLVDSSIKATKAQDGHYMNLRFDVSNGQNAGRVIFIIVNVNNKNPKATGIGLGQLKNLVTAAGKERWYEQLKTCNSWEDAEAHLNTLHSTIANIPVIGKVTVKRDETYGDKNDIKSFSKAQSVAPAAAFQKASAGKKSSPFDDA